ncbi:MAG: hypothetical protein SF066_05720, partial [Thermoanaerobaculia bacterium]|nr:hypothetical protein [Thermoanaerobaculia bacterium]
MPPTHPPPDALYAEREARFTALSRRLAAVGRRTGFARLLTFFVAAWSPLRSVAGAAGASAVEGWLSASAAVVFVALVVHDQRLARRRRHAEALAAVNTRARARLARDFTALGPAAPVPDDAPPWARELHLFGRTSLSQLLGTVATIPGRTTLARWLLTPAAPEVVFERQREVQRLAPRLDERQELEARGRLSGGGGERLESFYAWAEANTGLPRVVVWLARLASPVPLGVLVATLAGALSGQALALVLVSVYLASLAFGRRLGATLEAATAGTDGFKDLAAVLAAAETLRRGGERAGRGGRVREPRHWRPPRLPGPLPPTPPAPALALRE